jgi:serine/threonine-protein kinase SRPK3
MTIIFLPTAYGQWKRYAPGGFHPVHLGDIINDRYVIEHRLGTGAFSAVWLARDKKTSLLVALKIFAAEASKKGSSDQFLCGSHNLLPCFPKLLGSFTIHGPNGEHLCEVMEPLGGSLADLLWHKDRLPFEVGVKVAPQIIEGVAALHEQGIIHGGKFISATASGLVL